MSISDVTPNGSSSWSLLWQLNQENGLPNCYLRNLSKWPVFQTASSSVIHSNLGCFLYFQCNCTGDAFCEQTKANVGPCQDQVLHAASPDTVVSCTAAQWICSANSECSTALEYYNRNCQAMFRGKRCSDRCMNSINILKRQPSANKLETCFCDGTEDYDCLNIKANMETLCFDQSNEIEDRIKSGSNSIAQTIHKWMILFTVITGLIFNYIGATYYVMANSIVDEFTNNEPPPPPTEIGVN